jgi:hypothetical protein
MNIPRYLKSRVLTASNTGVNIPIAIRTFEPDTPGSDNAQIAKAAEIKIKSSLGCVSVDRGIEVKVKAKLAARKAMRKCEGLQFPPESLIGTTSEAKIRPANAADVIVGNAMIKGYTAALEPRMAKTMPISSGINKDHSMPRNLSLALLQLALLNVNKSKNPLTA